MHTRLPAPSSVLYELFPSQSALSSWLRGRMISRHSMSRRAVSSNLVCAYVQYTGKHTKTRTSYSEYSTYTHAHTYKHMYTHAHTHRLSLLMLNTWCRFRVRSYYDLLPTTEQSEVRTYVHTYIQKSVTHSPPHIVSLLPSHTLPRYASTPVDYSHCRYVRTFLLAPQEAS